MKQDKKNIVEMVKRKLWMFSYSVKDASGLRGASFDLLVDGQIRVQVGTERPTKLPKDCEVYAVVERDSVYFLTRPSHAITLMANDDGLVETTSPIKVFGKKK